MSGIGTTVGLIKSIAGMPTDAQVAAAVDDWLDEHPEAVSKHYYVTPEDYGAVGDGETDDKEAIESAFAAAYSESKTMYFPEKTYYSSAPIVVEDVPNIYMDGVIKFANTGNGLTIGKPSNVIYEKRIRVNVSCTQQSASDDYFGLKIICAVNCMIEINSISGFCTGVILMGDGAAFAYNTILINNIRSVVKSLAIQRQNTGGYNNENLFIGGRFYQTSSDNDICIDIIGNNHVFIKPCMEHAHYCMYFRSQDNKVIGCRSENSTYIAKFEDNAYFNEIDVSYGTIAVDGFVNMNNITYNKIGTNMMEAVGSKLVSSYNNVFESCYLASKVSVGETTYSGTVSEPLYWLDGDGIRRSSIAIASIGKAGNELVLNGGCIGVKVDCSIAKEFMLLQNGSGCGKWTIKLFDANGDQLNMSQISIGPSTDYNTAWGGVIYYSNYPLATIELPSAAKTAFIGLRQITGTSLLTFAIKTRKLSIVLP